MDLKKELELCIRSRFPLLCIVSQEEERIVDIVSSLCESRICSTYSWDHADFFQQVCSGSGGDGASVPTAKDPLTALETIDKTSGDVVFLLCDFHQCWDKQPRIVRTLRNLVPETPAQRSSSADSGAARSRRTKKVIPLDPLPNERSET